MRTLRQLIAGVCAAFLMGSTCVSQPSGEDILKRMEASLSDIQDYTADLDVTADMERMNVPPMHVRMYYKKPDKFHFDSEGFALLPREGLAFSPSRMLSRFTVEEVTEDTLMQQNNYKMVLRPKDERARAAKVFLYVDEKHWKPTRITTSLFDGHTVTATFAYGMQGEYLMPSSLTVEVSSAASSDTSDQSPDQDMGPIQRPRMPRTGTVTIRYSHYQINTGLSDDIFDTKK